MQKIGILIETKDGRPKTANFGVITASQGENSERYALLLEGTAADAKNLLQSFGIKKVI